MRLKMVVLIHWLLRLYLKSLPQKFLESEMHKFTNVFNTSYLIDSYIVFTLKIESVYKTTIFGLKMVKSGLEKIFLKFIHDEAIFFQFILLHRKEENLNFSNKNNHFPCI